jgi:hypothetical protein
MESVLAALKDTPIPTIMVVAGIVFLLLSIAGQLAGRITVPPEQRRQATIIGCLLVVVGVALHVVPPMLNRPKLPEAPPPTTPQPAPTVEQPPQPSTPPPGIQPAPQTPAPPTQGFTGELIPSLNARATALRFFEANPCEVPPPERRAYGQRFPKMVTREILTELTLEHPKHARRLGFTIQAFYRHEGKVIGRPELERHISADKQASVYWFEPRTGSLRLCTHPYPRGHWSAGSYTVEVYLNGAKAASGSFEISE